MPDKTPIVPVAGRPTCPWRRCVPLSLASAALEWPSFSRLPLTQVGCRSIIPIGLGEPGALNTSHCSADLLRLSRD